MRPLLLALSPEVNGAEAAALVAREVVSITFLRELPEYHRPSIGNPHGGTNSQGNISAKQGPIEYPIYKQMAFYLYWIFDSIC